MYVIVSIIGREALKRPSMVEKKYPEIQVEMRVDRLLSQVDQ